MCASLVYILAEMFGKGPDGAALRHLSAASCNSESVHLYLSLVCSHCGPPSVVLAEPVSVIEPTVVAALNMNYPGPRLTVHVLDDGNRAAVADMVDRLQYQCRCVKDAEHCVARLKAKCPF
jgi:hypothetical protein